MTHPAQPVAEGVLLPSLALTTSQDMMDGYNLILSPENFNILVPSADTEDSIKTEKGAILQGHMHLYINGVKVMRVYGNALHVPSFWLRPGINSLTLSINNHQHGAYTFEDKEIQATVIVNTLDSEGWLKSKYAWPSVQSLEKN